LLKGDQQNSLSDIDSPASAQYPLFHQITAQKSFGIQTLPVETTISMNMHDISVSQRIHSFKLNAHDKVLLKWPLQGYKVDKDHTQACAMTTIQDIIFFGRTSVAGLPKIPASDQILQCDIDSGHNMINSFPGSARDLLNNNEN